MNKLKKELVTIFSTKKLFWPSGSFIRKWAAYAEQMEREGKAYLNCEQYYKQGNHQLQS